MSSWAKQCARLNLLIGFAVLISSLAYVIVFRVFSLSFPMPTKVWFAFFRYSIILWIIANLIFLLARRIDSRDLTNPQLTRRGLFWAAILISIPLIIAMPLISAVLALIGVEK